MFIIYNSEKMSAIKTYLQNAIQELNHVTWPTKSQTIRISFIVIGFILVFATILGAVDFGFTQFFKFILELASK